MNTYILDASVVVRYLLSSSEEVAKRLPLLLRGVKDSKFKLYSSFLLSLEVCNSLRFSLVDKQKLETVLSKLFKLPIKYLKLTNAQLSEAASLSYDLGTTVYDTSYHILAKAHNAIFLTCDEDYYKKAKDLGDIEFIG